MRAAILTLGCVVAIAAGINAGAATLPLDLVAEIGLPGSPTRFDYQSIDPARRLLFVAHLGDSSVLVFDVSKRRVVTTIQGIDAVHGVLAVPQLHRVYASATGSNEIVAIDENRLRVVARTPGGVYPDGMAYDPSMQRLFVSDEHGKTETVIDARTNQRIATIDLGGEVGNSQYDSVTRRVWVNVQTRDELVAIDPTTNRIVQRTRLPGCIGNHGLAIDSAGRRAFVACEDNAAFLWVDLRTMRPSKTWTIGNDPDVLALDTQRRRLYVAAETGTMSIFATDPRVERVAQGFLAPAAHSVAVDPLTHDLYFPLENAGGSPVLLIAKELRRR